MQTVGLKSDQIVYADALEWDNKSERIIFDQLNRIKRGDSEDLEYWDIGIMDVWNSEKNKFDNLIINKINVINIKYNFKSS